MAAVHQLVEPFHQLDATRWQFTSWAASIATGGRLRTASALGDPLEDPGRIASDVWSVDAGDLTGSALTVELWERDATASGVTHVALFTDRPYDNAVAWRVEDQPWADGVRLRAVAITGGAHTTVATLPADQEAHRFLGISADSAGTVTWSTSPDGFSWTQQATQPATIPLAALRVALGSWYTSPGDVATGGAQFDNINVPLTTGDVPTLTGEDGQPYLAVDVQPDTLTGVFRIGTSVLGGPDRLAWSRTLDVWSNVVCDVRDVRYRRGATRQQGVLTRTEAGTGTVLLEDTAGRFDPNLNGGAIRKGTPARVRAWGYAPTVELLEERRSRALNPRVAVDLAGWGVFGGGGTADGTRHLTGGPLPDAATFLRRTWGTAATSATGGHVYGDAAAAGTHVLTCTPGEQLAAGLWVRCSVRQRLAAILQTYVAAGGGSALSTVTGAHVVVEPGVWTWLSVAATVPANAGRFTVSAYARTGTDARVWQVGDQLDASAVLIEAGATLGDYFDGDSPDAGNPDVPGAVDYSWAGASHASHSVQRVATTVGDQRWDAVLFTGDVDHLGVEYLPDEDAPLVTMTLVDLVGPLAGWESEGLPGDGVGAGENLLGRARRILGLVGRGQVSGNSSSTYAATLAPTPMREPWTELQDATEAELGRCWIDKHNRVQLRARGSQPSGPVRGTLSTAHGEAPLGVHCCVSAAAIVSGAEGLANRVLGSRVRLEGQADPAVVRRDDEQSARLYGVGSVNRVGQLRLQTDAQVAEWAGALITARTRPELRVESVTPYPSPEDLDSALVAWPAVMQTDLGDRWLFRYQPRVGPLIESGVAVLGIDAQLSPDGWSVVWTTEQAPVPGKDNPTGWFILGTSKLGGPDLLAPYSAPYRTD